MQESVMSAVKQSHVQQQRFFFQQQKTIDITNPQSKELRQAWIEEDAEQKSSRREAETAHCAVLGYN
jgi:hypothetical protein